jgi:hypothetical protein
MISKIADEFLRPPAQIDQTPLSARRSRYKVGLPQQIFVHANIARTIAGSERG